MYVRNGGNPVTNSDMGREAHWFDGDGMLSGVWFEQSPEHPEKVHAKFVNQFVLTDLYLSAVENSDLRTPILPSIATLVNPASSLLLIVWRIMRAVFFVFLSHFPGLKYTVSRISVANTAIFYHDGRALATCESGPPIRVTLPELDTVGWYDGRRADGEELSNGQETSKEKQKPGFGGTGPLSWMREWTTGHPKVDNTTGEMALFHCSFAPPYVQYSLIPTEGPNPITDDASQPIINAPVPGCSGGKLMHDFGVSRRHTIILDLPLTLSPFNLAKNKPVVHYEPHKASRFGVFPRRHPELVRWFETSGCCVFHTANSWDEVNPDGNVAAVSLLACRMTSASVVFSAGNIVPPPHPDAESSSSSRKPMSFFAKYDEDEHYEDPEKTSLTETTPLLSPPANSATTPSGVPISNDEHEQCRLYYYRFPLGSQSTNRISHQFALSAIPFEFPTVSPRTEMTKARYIYGCSNSVESFGAALGKATKIDVLVRIDVQTLLARSTRSMPLPIHGCVDKRPIEDVLDSRDPHDPIKAFKLPPNHFAQEARFVPRSTQDGSETKENDGYLLFYVFNEDQLNGDGECAANARSELWVLDAHTMEKVVCKVQLPTRIPYGLHGNWFTEEQIRKQREVKSLRSTPNSDMASSQGILRRKLIRSLR